jgi:hypothetical protein
MTPGRSVLRRRRPARCGRVRQVACGRSAPPAGPARGRRRRSGRRCDQRIVARPVHRAPDVVPDMGRGRVVHARSPSEDCSSNGPVARAGGDVTFRRSEAAIVCLHDAGLVADVLELLDRHGPEAAVLAGGQSLVPMMNLRLARPPCSSTSTASLVWTRWRSGTGSCASGRRSATRPGEGAAARPARCGRRAARSAARRRRRHVGHLPIRIRGTLAGSLAHADPNAEWPVVATALGATLVLAARPDDGRSRRRTSSTCRSRPPARPTRCCSRSASRCRSGLGRGVRRVRAHRGRLRHRCGLRCRPGARRRRRRVPGGGGRAGRRARCACPRSRPRRTAVRSTPSPGRAARATSGAAPGHLGRWSSRWPRGRCGRRRAGVPQWT